MVISTESRGSDFAPGASPRLIGGAPWHFRLAKYLIDHQVRGGYRLIDTARKLGWLNVIARYPLDNGVTVDVPLYRVENPWSERDIREYEDSGLSFLTEALGRRPGPVTLVDCGADIGLFSVLLASRGVDLARVVAFEPNLEAFPILKKNVARLPRGECHAAAVSDFSGQAELRSPRPGTSGHARFIVPSPKGDIPVMRVDDLEVDPRHNLLLKIDVEGAELNVLRGAVRALSAADWFVVFFEAHPKVVRRTGIDPTECMRLLRSVRPCRFVIDELPEVQLVDDRPFFEQVPERIYNVVCLAEP
jgi:FkbM family methyltransferase